MEPRKASIHFEPVKNIRSAINHDQRTSKYEPTYLLPKEHRHANITLDFEHRLTDADLVKWYNHRAENMTAVAKAKGSSPFWEGVINLSRMEGNVNAWKRAEAEKVQKWIASYERLTGMKVLHASIHLDEGYMDEGKPIYNPHAHVIVDRMDHNHKIIRLERAQMSQVQDLTAEVMEMTRGETPAQRGGKRGRKHRDHYQQREMSESLRAENQKTKLAEKAATINYSALKTATNNLVEFAQEASADKKRAQAAEAKAAKLTAELVESAQATASAQARIEAATDAAVRALQAPAQYRELRAFLIGSKQAQQSDYSALKTLSEKNPKAIEALLAHVETGDVAGVLNALREPPRPRPKLDLSRFGSYGKRPAPPAAAPADPPADPPPVAPPPNPLQAPQRPSAAVRGLGGLDWLRGKPSAPAAPVAPPVAPPQPRPPEPDDDGPSGP